VWQSKLLCRFRSTPQHAYIYIHSVRPFHLRYQKFAEIALPQNGLSKRSLRYGSHFSLVRMFLSFFSGRVGFPSFIPTHYIYICISDPGEVDKREFLVVNYVFGEIWLIIKVKVYIHQSKLRF